MFLLAKLLIGACMISLSVIIHAIVCDLTFRFIGGHARPMLRVFGRFWTIPALIATVFLIGASIMAQIWVWTLLFWQVDASIFASFEDALYFSTITFTTVGYGDVVMQPAWRLLSGTEAINGMLIFGWSAATIFEVMYKLYEGNKSFERWKGADGHVD